MMSPINSIIEAIGNLPVPSILVNSTIIAALGLTGARLARKGRAAVRHALPIASPGALAALTVFALSPLRVVAAPQLANADPQGTGLPQFSASGMLVVETVRAADAGGRDLPGLRASDFAVTEDGVLQVISLFEFQPTQSNPAYYVLGYYTSNRIPDGQLRKIRITYKGDAAARLDYRTGYHAGPFSVLGRPPGFNPPTPPIAGTLSLDPAVPQPTYEESPEYSDAARKAKYQGTVALVVTVNTSGEVEHVRVVRSLGLGLDEKAIEAVRQWKFRPAMKDGQLVTVPVAVNVTFRLL